MKKALVILFTILAATPATASDVDERCGTKLTWKAIRCAMAYGDAETRRRRAAKYENWAKHADLDGDENLAQYYRNRAAFTAAESERLQKVFETKYPKQ